MGTTSEVLQFIIKADGGAAGNTFKELGANAEAAGNRAKQSLSGVGGGIQGFASQFSSAFSALPPGLKELTVGVGAVGGAVAAFAIKSATDFKDLALEVGKFSDATGVSADQASRLIKVSEDLNVPIDAVQGSIAKMAKAIQAGSFDSLGIAVKKAKDGTTDLNGTLLNVVQHLNLIPDAAQRDAEAAKIFGKGWQSIAPLISQPVADLKKQLDGVQQSSIVSDSQVNQARSFRDAMNSLQNSFKAISQTLGGTLLPYMATLASEVALVTKPLQLLASQGRSGTDALGGLAATAASAIPVIGPGLGGALTFLAGQADQTVAASDRAAKKQEEMRAVIANTTEGIDSAGRAQQGFIGDLTAGQIAAQNTAAAQRDLADQTAAAAQQQQIQSTALTALADGAKTAAGWVKTLNDAEKAQLDTTKSLLKLQTDLPGEYRDVATAAQEADKAVQAANKANGKNAELNAKAADATQKLGDKLLSTSDDFQTMAEKAALANGVTLTAQQSTVEYAKGLLTAAGSSKTAQAAALAYLGTLKDISKPVVAQVTAQVNKGDLPGALATLQQFEGTHVARAVLSVSVIGDVNTFRTITAEVGGGLTVTASRFRASGGPVAGGTAYVVGEKGPELFVPSSSGSILPHSGGLSGGHVSINIGTVVANDPAALVTALERYVQQGGKGRLQKLVGV